DRALGLRIADYAGDPRARDHQPTAELHLHFDEVAVACLPEVAAGDAHFLLLAVDGDEAGAIVVHPHDADLAAARLVEDLHRPRGVERHRAAAALDPGQDSVARTGHDPRRARLDH